MNNVVGNNDFLTPDGEVILGKGIQIRTIWETTEARKEYVVIDEKSPFLPLTVTSTDTWIPLGNLKKMFDGSRITRKVERWPKSKGVISSQYDIYSDNFLKFRL